jgi:hypothetical protein
MAKITEHQWLLGIGQCKTQFEMLKYTCALYANKQMNKPMFVWCMIELFRDDHGMDWADDGSIDVLVKAIKQTEE